jgi:hypothetical protein
MEDRVEYLKHIDELLEHEEVEFKNLTYLQRDLYRNLTGLL